MHYNKRLFTSTQAQLQGSDPMAVLSAAKSAVAFWMQRTHHYHAAEADMLRAQLQEQYAKCKQKLVELHNGYQQARRWCCHSMNSGMKNRNTGQAQVPRGGGAACAAAGRPTGAAG